MSRAAAPARLTRWPLPGGDWLEVLVTREPERHFAPHWHEQWSIGAVLEGRCRFACAGQLHEASAGELVVMPPFALHTAGVSAGVFRMAMAYVPHGWLASQLGWSGDRVPCAAIVTPHAKLAQALGDAAQGEALEPLLVAIAEIAALQARDVPVGPHAQTHDPRIEHLCRLLLQDASEGGAIDIPALARELGVSREHLHRLFRAALGLTPMAYARLARIARAKALLSEGHAPAAVAAQCGFADQAHFARWFRRCFGVAPGRYGLVGRAGLEPATKGL